AASLGIGKQRGLKEQIAGEQIDVIEVAPMIGPVGLHALLHVGAGLGPERQARGQQDDQQDRQKRQPGSFHLSILTLDAWLMLVRCDNAKDDPASDTPYDQDRTSKMQTDFPVARKSEGFPSGGVVQEAYR